MLVRGCSLPLIVQGRGGGGAKSFLCRTCFGASSPGSYKRHLQRNLSPAAAGELMWAKVLWGGASASVCSAAPG